MLHAEHKPCCLFILSGLVDLSSGSIVSHAESKQQATACQVGIVQRVNNGADLAAACAAAATCDGTVVLDASDWQIIPAENLVAAYQVRGRSSGNSSF